MILIKLVIFCVPVLLLYANHRSFRDCFLISFYKFNCYVYFFSEGSGLILVMYLGGFLYFFLSKIFF